MRWLTSIPAQRQTESQCPRVPSLLFSEHAAGCGAEPAVIQAGKGRIQRPRGRARKTTCHSHAKRDANTDQKED